MAENISITKYGPRLILLLLLSALSIGSCCAQNTDIEWLREINGHRTAGRDKLMAGFTNSVYPVAAALPLSQLIYGYSKQDEQSIRNGWESAEALGLNFVVAFSLKYAVNRTRPYVTYADIDPYQHNSDPSCPSGHTSFSFATATALSLEYRKWYIVVPSYLWAGTVGFSRMYLGMHYPSDVLGGALVGAGSAWLSYRAQSWINKKFTHKEKRK